MTSALVGIFGFTTASSFAQGTADTAAAQGLFDEAKALMASGKASEACPKLEESQRLDPGSGTLINLAKCYEDTGRIASAWSTYLEAAAAAKATGNAEREQGARDRADALAPRVSRLVVKVAPDARIAGLEVLRDGNLVGPAQWGIAIPANEGRHEIVAKAPGHQEWKSVAKVTGEGTTAEITISRLGEAIPDGTSADIAPGEKGVAPGSSSLGTQKTLALVAGGVGVAGIAVGTVFGLKATSRKSDADKSCTGTACTTDAGVSAGNDAHSAGNVATVGMVVGAVGLAGGLALWFTAPKESPSTEVALGVGTIQLRGAW